MILLYKGVEYKAPVKVEWWVLEKMSEAKFKKWVQLASQAKAMSRQL